MSNEVDRYDVEAMIRDARHEIRGETDRAVNVLRDELRRVEEDLRDGLADVRAQLAAVTA